MSWIGVGVLKTGAEKTENLLIEETFSFLLVVPLLRGKGNDGGKSKEGGRNKMKRMVAVAVIAVLACALFLVPNVSAELIKISVNVTPIKGDFESSFTYVVTITNQYPFNVTGPLNLTVGSDYNNKSIKLDAYDQIISIPHDGTNASISKVVRFTDPALMQGDFKNWTTEGKPCSWKRAWYKACFKYDFGHVCNGTDVSPLLTLPKPKTKLICPGSVAWCKDFIWTFYVEDKMGGSGNFQILVDNLPLVNGSVDFPAGGGKYTYPKDGYKRRPFNESMVCRYFTVIFNYSNLCHDINKSCGGHVAQTPPPDIKAYLDEEELSEEHNNTIYLEENTNHTFKAKIEDYVEANASLKLDVYKNNESYWNCTWNNRTIKVTPDVPFERECDIPFKKERNNFTMILSYSRLNETFDKAYSLNIIPLDIKFEKGSVEREVGNWTDKFNYSVWMNASVWMSGDLTVTLNVYDPYRESEPWIPLREPDEPYTKEDVNKPKKLNWTNKKPFENYCAGQSKFYFEYGVKEHHGESQVYLGPYLGPVLKPPEFDNGTPNPNVTIYCNWSKSSTPCNYSVNVSTEDEYKVRLLVKDPNSNDWIPKGDVKDVSRETKNPVTWYDIEPFESLDIDNITQYIDNGTRADFTFEYDGHRYEEKTPFPGPELVAAFKDPKVELEPEDEVINYNDTFYYSVNVIGSEKLLNITLRYLCDGKWISENITKPTKEYTSITKWQPLNWTCKAINSWEEVRFDVNVTGEEKPIEVC